MRTTKTVTGKKTIVTSGDDVCVGDFVRTLDGYTKNKKRKFSLNLYKIVEIEVDSVKVEMEGEDVRFFFDEIRLHTINLLEVQRIRIDFTCRESGYQTQFITEHDFEFGVDDCKICGSHGYLNVDVKCKCGKTHSIELKSW